MEKCNLPNEERKIFGVYRGKATEQMPILRADGRVPISVERLMQRRLELRDDTSGVKDFYMNNCFDTGDAIVYHPDGRAKIVLDSQHLRDANPNTPRYGAALALGEDVYETLEGKEFEKEELERPGKPMPKAEVKAHPVWNVLARNRRLLEDYADYIFSELAETYSHCPAMGVLPLSVHSGAPEMRTWCIDSIGFRSDAKNRTDLDIGSACLVGVASDALDTPNVGASRVKTYTPADLRAVDKERED